jgi:hypothetical protein
MLGLEIEDDLGVVRFPDREAISHELSETMFRFGTVFHGRGHCRIGVGLSTEGPA